MFLEDLALRSWGQQGRGGHQNIHCLRKSGAFYSLPQTTSAFEPYLYLLCVFSHFSSVTSHRPPHLLDSAVQPNRDPLSFLLGSSQPPPTSALKSCLLKTHSQRSLFSPTSRSLFLLAPAPQKSPLSSNLETDPSI